MTSSITTPSLTTPSTNFDTFISRLLDVEILRARVTALKLEYARTALRAGWINGDDAVAMACEASS